MAAPRFPLGPCAAALFVLAAGVAVCSEELELQAATGLAAGARDQPRSARPAP